MPVSETMRYIHNYILMKLEIAACLVLFVVHVCAILHIKSGERHPSLKQYHSVKFQSDHKGQLLQKRSDDTIYDLTVSIDGMTFELQLQVNDQLLHSDYRRNDSVADDGALFLKGSVRGYAGSYARVAMLPGDNMMEGHFMIDGQTYHLELMSESAVTFPIDLSRLPSSDWKTIAYRNDEIVDIAPSGRCLSDVLRPHAAFANYQKLMKRQTGALADPDCPIACIADIKLYSRFGPSTQTYMLSLINDIQGLYLEQLNVGLPVIFTYVVTSKTDRSGLGSPADTINALLVQLANAVGNSRFPDYNVLSSRVCLVHLFTSQNFASNLGLAYIGNVDSQPNAGACSLGYNTGVSTDILGLRDSNNQAIAYDLTRHSKMVTVAHELAHGLGAAHDNDITEPKCNIAGNRNMMYYSINSSPVASTMSSCTISAINSKLRRYSCIVDRGSQTSLSLQAYPDNVFEPFDHCATFAGPGFTECLVDAPQPN
eukprot:Partr_v1_DN28033_c5_g1_i2_m57315 putative ADAM metallopeptidase domain